MRLSVNQIMRQIAATVNQEATPPTDGGAEYLLWLEYINRAYFEWAQGLDWEVLRKDHHAVVSGPTVSLPLDFKKIASAPVLYSGDREQGVEFPEALPEQMSLYGPNDKYVTIRGDQSTGFSMLFHPATLASGASLIIQYFSMPTGLASPSEIPILSDSQYLIDRSVAYIFEARSDSRFQLEENKARERLLVMIEGANAAKYNSYANPNFVMGPERRAGFRLGRD